MPMECPTLTISLTLSPVGHSEPKTYCVYHSANGVSPRRPRNPYLTVADPDPGNFTMCDLPAVPYASQITLVAELDGEPKAILETTLPHEHTDPRWKKDRTVKYGPLLTLLLRRKTHPHPPHLSICYACVHLGHTDWFTQHCLLDSC